MDLFEKLEQTGIEFYRNEIGTFNMEGVGEWILYRMMANNFGIRGGWRGEGRKGGGWGR